MLLFAELSAAFSDANISIKFSTVVEKTGTYVVAAIGRRLAIGSTTAAFSRRDFALLDDNHDCRRCKRSASSFAAPVIDATPIRGRLPRKHSGLFSREKAPSTLYPHQSPAGIRPRV